MANKKKSGVHSHDATQPSHSGAMSDINITPLLQKGVDVKLPQAANSKEKQDKQNTVVVAVRKDLTLYLGSKPQPGGEAELAPKLREMIEVLPDTEKTVYLKADVEVPYSDVMRVMEMCRKAGAEEVALIAEKKVS